MLLRAGRPAVTALSVTVGVGVGHGDVGTQHLRDVLTEPDGPDQADGRCHRVRGRPPPPRRGIGHIEETEDPCGRQKHCQGGLEAEGQQRGADQGGQHRQQRPGVEGEHPMPSAPARVEVRARQASHSVPNMHNAPNIEKCSIGKFSTAPSAGR